MASVFVPCTCTITKNKNNANKPTINCLCRIGGTNVARVSSTISAIIPSIPTSTTASTNVPIYVPSTRSNTNIINSMKKQVAAAAIKTAAAANTAATANTASSRYNNAPSSRIQKVLNESPVEYTGQSGSTGPVPGRYWPVLPVPASTGPVEYKKWAATTQTRIDDITSSFEVITEDVRKINNEEDKKIIEPLYLAFLITYKSISENMKKVGDKIDSNTGEVDKMLTTAETALKTLKDAVNKIKFKTPFSILGNNGTKQVGISNLPSLFKNTNVNTGSNEEDPFATKPRKQRNGTNKPSAAAPSNTAANTLAKQQLDELRMGTQVQITKDNLLTITTAFEKLKKSSEFQIKKYDISRTDKAEEKKINDYITTIEDSINKTRTALEAPGPASIGNASTFILEAKTLLNFIIKNLKINDVKQVTLQKGGKTRRKRKRSRRTRRNVRKENRG